MEGLFVIVVFIMLVYSFVDLIGVYLELKCRWSNSFQKKNLYISGFLRVAVTLWGLFCLLFVTGSIHMGQMFRIMPSIALCLIMTDEGTLKWLKDKNQG